VRRRFLPSVERVEGRISPSTLFDVPGATAPVTPGLLQPGRLPVAPAGIGTPGQTTVLPLPDDAPPLPAGDYPLPDPGSVLA
jgi:hypothetical protein